MANAIVTFKIMPASPEVDCDAIVEVKDIPMNHLQVDIRVDNHPSDINEAIERVNNGDEVILKLFKELPHNSFTYLNKLRRK